MQRLKKFFAKETRKPGARRGRFVPRGVIGGNRGVNIRAKRAGWRSVSIKNGGVFSRYAHIPLYNRRKAVAKCCKAQGGIHTAGRGLFSFTGEI